MWKNQTTVCCIPFITFFQKDSKVKLLKTINKDILYYYIIKPNNEGFSISQR